MKKFNFYIVVLLCMSLVSCTEDKMPGNMVFGIPSSSSGSSGSGSGTEVANTISASHASLSFTADGGSKTVTITSNFTWNEINVPSWISLSPSTGSSGSTTVTVVAEKNTGSTALLGTITLGGSSATVSIPVAQETASSTVSYNTYTVNGVSFKMIEVEGGTFTMGGTVFKDEAPAHSVTLDSYSIGETEVTQELWEAVMGNKSPSVFRGLKLPVDAVTWDECQEFINNLNALTGKTFRLPTEAEWEYAARGGNKSKGYEYAGSNTVEDVAWYMDNSDNKTHNVATKAANELGLYDMSGNVVERCYDWYGTYSSEAQTNPTGPSTGETRVLRGGAYGAISTENRVSRRWHRSGDIHASDTGLRLAL